MTTSVSVSPEQRNRVITAFQQLSQNSGANRKLEAQNAVLAQLILSKLHSETPRVEALRKKLSQADDLASIEISQDDAKGLVALMEANAPASGGWFSSWFGGGPRTGGVGSGFAAHAAEVLAATLEKFIPGWNRVTTVIEKQGPTLARTFDQFADKLRPQIDALITGAIARITGDTKISLEKWERVKLEIQTIIRFLENGNGSEPDYVSNNRDQVITFVDRLLGQSDSDHGLVLTEEETQKLQALKDFIDALDFTNRESLTEYLRSASRASADSSANGEEAATADAGAAKPAIHPLTEGLEVIKSLEKQYVSLLSRLSSVLKAEPKTCYLESYRNLKFLLRQLNRDPNEEDIELVKKDAEGLLKLREFLLEASREPGLNDNDHTLTALMQTMYQGVQHSDEGVPQQPLSKLWDVKRPEEGLTQEPAVALVITPDMRRMEDAKTAIKKACQFLKTKIAQESGLVFTAAQKGEGLFQETEAALRKRLFKKPEEARLLRVLSALQAISRLSLQNPSNLQNPYLRIQAEKEIIRSGIQAAIELNRDIRAVRFAPVDEATAFRGRIREINTSLAGLSIQYGWLGSWLSSPYLAGLEETPLRTSAGLTRAITDYNKLMDENAEGLAAKMERQGHEAARFVSAELRSLLDFTLWKVVKTVAVIGVAFIAFDFALYVLRRRVYDIFLSMVPLRAF